MKIYYSFVKIIKKTLYNIKLYNEPKFLLGYSDVGVILIFQIVTMMLYYEK